MNYIGIDILAPEPLGESSRSEVSGSHSSNSLGLPSCPASSQGRREEVATRSNGGDCGDKS